MEMQEQELVCSWFISDSHGGDSYDDLFSLYAAAIYNHLDSYYSLFFLGYREKHFCGFDSFGFDFWFNPWRVEQAELSNLAYLFCLELCIFGLRSKWIKGLKVTFFYMLFLWAFLCSGSLFRNYFSFCQSLLFYKVVSKFIGGVFFSAVAFGSSKSCSLVDGNYPPTSIWCKINRYPRVLFFWKNALLVYPVLKQWFIGFVFWIYNLLCSTYIFRDSFDWITSIHLCKFNQWNISFDEVCVCFDNIDLEQQMDVSNV